MPLEKAAVVSGGEGGLSGHCARLRSREMLVRAPSRKAAGGKGDDRLRRPESPSPRLQDSTSQEVQGTRQLTPYHGRPQPAAWVPYGTASCQMRVHAEGQSEKAPSTTQRTSRHLSPLLLVPLMFCLLLAVTPQCQAGLPESRSRLALVGYTRQESSEPEGAFRRVLGTFQALWRQTTWYQTTAEKSDETQQKQGSDPGAEQGRARGGRNGQAGGTDVSTQSLLYTGQEPIQNFSRGPLQRGRIRGLVRPHGGQSVSVGTSAATGGVAVRGQGQGAGVRPYGGKVRPDSWRRGYPHPSRAKLPYALRKRLAPPRFVTKPHPGTPGMLPRVASTAGALFTLEQAKQAKIGAFDPGSEFKCTVWVTKAGGKGAFTSIQGAIDSLDPTAGPATVCVGPGTFSERVTIHEGLDNVTLAGSGIDTVITAEVGALSVGGPFQAATMTVNGNYFRGSHFILENSLYTVTDPCPAVTTSTNRTSWQSVGFISWVDTVALRFGHHLFQDCVVSGLTDIIWGFGRAAFEDSVIWARHFPSPTTLYTGFIAVFGTDRASEGIVSGAVFHECMVVGDGQMCLGRPYRSQQHVVYADCYLGSNVCSDGWGDYNGYLAFQTFDLREFRSYGPGANPWRRKWGNVSFGPPPEMFKVENFLVGID